MYLFSVIVPHYNSVLSLKRLIDSIPVDRSVQLIVVDDKSTENVSEAGHLVCDRGGIFLHNTTSQKGAGTCRNIGLSHADGKWLIFADADDYFLDGAFDTLREYADSPADIIYFPPTSRYLDTDIIAKRHIPYEKLVRRYIENPSDENEILLRYKFMSPWSKIIRNQLVQEKQIAFDEVPASNDVMFSMITAYNAKSIQSALETIYCITFSENTLTTQKNEEKYWARVEVFVRRYQFMLDHIDVKKYRKVLPRGLFTIGTAIRQKYSIGFICKIYIYLRKHHVAMFYRSLAK